MKYDCVKHALTRDNVDLVATLAPGVSMEEGYAMADGFIGGNEIVGVGTEAVALVADLRSEISRRNNAADESDETIDQLREENDRLRKEMRELSEAECPPAVRVDGGTEVAP